MLKDDKLNIKLAQQATKKWIEILFHFRKCITFDTHNIKSFDILIFSIRNNTNIRQMLLLNLVGSNFLHFHHQAHTYFALNKRRGCHALLD